MIKNIIGFNLILLLPLNAQIFDGLTIFSPILISSKMTYLVDNNQNLINSWEHEYSPASFPYLMSDSSIIYPYRVQNPSMSNGAGGVGGGIQKILWDGTIIWDYTISDSIYQQHHDIEIMPNGNILLIVWERKSSMQASSVGRQYIESEINEIWAPAILELVPETGNISWEWHIWDHLIQNVDSSLINYGIVSENPQLIDINYGIIGSIDGANGVWMHINSIDYNATLDQIVISSRNMNEFYIIDHSTNIDEASDHLGGLYGKGGDFLYRWGNPEVYDMGGNEDRQLFGQHDVNWIENNFPGEGGLILFNNGIGRPDGNYSSIDIITPPIDENGNYLMSSNSVFLPDSLLSVYCEENFYSHLQSSVQRLINGNTLITSAVENRIFEINDDGVITWECNIIDGSVNIPRAKKYPIDYFNSLSYYKHNNNSRDNFILIQNYPNPFNPLTTLRYNLPEDALVNITIYDMMGRVVSNLVNSQQRVGHKSVMWNGTNNTGQPVSAGLYLYTIQAGEYTQTKNMVLLK